MLEASDADTAPDYIVFNITSPPRAGEVQKKRKLERAGWSVHQFQQSDLYQVISKRFISKLKLLEISIIKNTYIVNRR